MRKVFLVLLVLSILGFLFFLGRWILIDGGNDSWTTLFSVALIPLFSFLLKRSKKKNSEQEQIVATQVGPVSDFCVTINKAEIIADSEYADYRFQIEVSLNAIGRSVYIRNIRLECSKFTWTKPVIKLLTYFKPTGDDYLLMSLNKYRDNVTSLIKYPISDVVIRNDEWLYFLFTDVTHSERAPDSYENFELTSWDMIITYNDDQIKTIPFSFHIHKDSYKVPTAYKFTGFNGL